MKKLASLLTIYGLVPTYAYTSSSKKLTRGRLIYFAYTGIF